MPYDIHTLKYKYSQKYGIPESEIDESLIPIYQVIDAQNESLEAELKKHSAIIEKQLIEIKELNSERKRAIIYENPKSAYWGNIGANLHWVILVIFFILLITVHILTN